MKIKNLKKTLLASTILTSLMTLSFDNQLRFVNFAKAEEPIQNKQLTTGFELINNKINKSPSDDRQYQAIKLENGMTVLLVSDQKATKSLGVLALPIGSLDDPNSQQGLAHYLEHMVLMGSQKYPEPSGFSEFLKKHGGSHNASTAPYRTNFFFDIDDSGLPEALDRLADAIAQPLLDPGNADKERNAVNAELTLARSRDGMRMAQIGAETINPAHPASKFFGGNLETLSDKPNSKLQDALTNFYQTYYSSNLMVGVIYSPRPINELTQLATQSFGRIVNKNASVPLIDTPFLREEDKGIVIHYVPVQPIKQLEIEFVIPNTKIDPTDIQFLEKNETFISYLIGNASPGTLAQTLKSQGLINNIYAGASLERFRNAGAFVINIDLTDEGLAKRDEVVAAVFNYLDLMKRQGIDKSYFDEVKQVLNIDFEFPTLSRDADYAAELADNMLMRPIEHIVDADNAIGTFNPTAIQNRLNAMTIENARIWFVSPDEPHDKEAYFVNAPYKVVSINAEQKAKWQNLQSQWQFNLPKLNPYLADDFTIHYQTKDVIDKPQLIANDKLAALADDKTLSNLAIKVFHMPSKEFTNQPQADITVVLRNELSTEALDPTQQMHDQILFALTDYIAGLALNELSYQANVAGISFSSYYDNGLVLSANGYTQHLLRLMLGLSEQYAQFEATEAQFEQAKAWYLDQLLSADKVKPFELALQPLQTLSRVPYFERDERRLALQNLKLADLKKFRDNLFNQKRLEVLSVGNAKVENIATFIHDFNVKMPQLISQQGEQFKPDFGKTLVLKTPEQYQLNRAIDASDSALGLLYIPKADTNIDDTARKQITVKNEAKAKLLNEIIQPWFYDKLRSQEQLGYAVFTLPFAVGEQWGIGFLLQSNIKQPAELKTYFDNFNQSAIEQLNALTDDVFIQYQKGLIAQLNEPAQTVGNEANNFQADFSRGQYDFARKQTLIDAVAQTKKAEIIAFFKDLVIDKQGIGILSQVSGTEQPEHLFTVDPSWKTIKNVSTLQSSLDIRQN